MYVDKTSCGVSIIETSAVDESSSDLVCKLGLAKSPNVTLLVTRLVTRLHVVDIL